MNIVELNVIITPQQGLWVPNPDATREFRVITQSIAGACFGASVISCLNEVPGLRDGMQASIWYRQRISLANSVPTYVT
jgi:hypothetical protein